MEEHIAQIVLISKENQLTVIDTSFLDDNVTALDYPPMLITGGVADPRVTYWEPSKWAAKLRAEAPKAGPYFLRINLDSGHFGASGRFEGLKETAIEYAFALAAAGQIDTVDLSKPE